MCILALLILAFAGAIAAPMVSDSSTADSLVQPLPFHGAVSALGKLDVYRTFTRDAIAGLPYRTLEDVLDWRTASYTLSTGAIGDWNVPLLFGERLRDLAVRADGVPMASAAVGIVPPAMMSPEFMERMDLLIGSDAAILAGASSGTAYWFQQPWYDTRTPYTRVWYCQSAYDFLATDGVLSQNVARNVNATLGFRRMVTPGRYPNQWLDVWNTRALLRWNVSPVLNFSIVHRFANWGLGTNGGVDPTISDDPTNERTAQVFYSRLDERLFRHDVALLATYQLSPHRVASAGIALQLEQWNLYRAPALAIGVDSSTHVLWRNDAVTAFVRWEERLDSQLIAFAGAEASAVTAGRSDYTAALAGSDRFQGAGFGYVRWDASPFLLRGGVRLLFARGLLLPIAGAAVRVGDSAFALTFDGSRTVRIPSLVEGLLPPERAWLLMVRLETAFETAVRVAATGYWRRYDNPIVAEPIARGDTVIATSGVVASPMHRSGLTVETLWRIGRFQLRPHLVFSFTGARELPFLYAAISLGYEHRIGRNRIGGELFLRARTQVFADRFIPQSWGFLPTEIPLPAATDGGTVMLWAQLGNANVKLAMGNVLSAYYATLSTFPQFDRHITLSVGWSFFD
jgi:hypothetical protein